MGYRDEAVERANSIAKAVAAALGDGWAYVEPEPDRDVWFATLRQGAGPAELHVSEREGRITWSAVYPRDNLHQEHAPRDNAGGRLSITTAPGKPVDATAKDVTRRLLVPYREQLVKCVAERDQANDYAGRSERNAAALAALVGKEPNRRNSSVAERRISFYQDGGAYGDVQVNGDSVSIDLRSLTVEQAAAVLRLVVRAEAEKAAA